jgi:hypothetical protein
LRPQSGSSAAKRRRQPLAKRYLSKETVMNEDVFNLSIRKFLKTLGVTAQREIEQAVRQALNDGRIKGNEKLAAKATVSIGALKFTHEVGADIELE